MKILKGGCLTLKVTLYLASVLFHGLKLDRLLEQDIVPLLPGFMDISVQYLCSCYESFVYKKCKNIGR